MDVSTALFSLIAGAGGGSAVVAGIAKFGGRMIEQKVRAGLSKDLESYKGELKKEMEAVKTQGPVYDEVWEALTKLDTAADILWSKATRENLRDFRDQMQQTSYTLERYSYLLRKDHYQELIDVLNAFRDYDFGKEELLRLRDLADRDFESLAHPEAFVESYANKPLRDKYKRLRRDVCDDFREYLLPKGRLASHVAKS